MALKSKSRYCAKDRIRELPVEVLRHILSFLPTKYAVRTSCLSSKWKNIWASVPILNFHHDYFSGDAGFSMFVERVLFMRDSSDIQRFSLCCRQIQDFSRVDGWIRTAIRRNVVELSISAIFDRLRIYELPKSLCICKSLMFLELLLNFTIKVPTSGCFPSLKYLCVMLFGMADKDSMNRLFSQCPVLEVLTIKTVSGIRHVVLDINISAPELKMLTIYLGRAGALHNLFVNAPKLENLNLCDSRLSNYIFENVKSLIKADIDLSDQFGIYDPGYVNRVTALLAGISHVKYLSAPSFEGCCLPAFDSLKHLELDLYDCNIFKSINELLKRSLNLEYLGANFNECIEEYLEHPWIQPNFVPNCLLSYLKTVSIRKFEGRQADMEVAKFLLKNSKVLNNITIATSDPQCAKKELYKEFCFLAISQLPIRVSPFASI
ncbi:FBD-associated F-box protein At5g60610-like [Pyrus communis]|uniref:FBD-associated F-box protein At5g60610-like n=1 Tax=Pyrus communis TaxID=23211 RepID=UPI0035BF6192